MGGGGDNIRRKLRSDWHIHIGSYADFTLLCLLSFQVNVSDVSHGVVQGIVKNPHKFKMVDNHGRRKGYVYSLVPQIYAESDYRKGGLPAGY